jgi:hypothetical protein
MLISPSMSSPPPEVASASCGSHHRTPFLAKVQFAICERKDSPGDFLALPTHFSWPTHASTANWRQSDSDTPNIDAYDCYLRGRELLAMNPKNRERFE